jgi:tetratricopeptide (TPR) repeat protein
MKTKSIILLVLLVCHSIARAEDDAETYQALYPAVVCIESYVGKQPPRLGSGFLVAPRVLATASHQVKGVNRIMLQFSDGTQEETSVTPLAQQGEITLLKLEERDHAYLAVEGGPLRQGEKVLTIGCPRGREPSISFGEVKQLRRLGEQGGTLIETELEIQQGNSGGALINEVGEVVGVIDGFHKDSNRISFSVPATELLALMQDNGMNPESLSSPLALPAKDLYAQGISHFGQDRFEQARDRFERVLRQYPEHDKANVNLGMALYKLGRHSEARDTLIKAVTVNPNYALAFLNLGIVYREGLNDLASSQRALQRYLQLDLSGAEADGVWQLIQKAGAGAVQ